MLIKMKRLPLPIRFLIALAHIPVVLVLLAFNDAYLTPRVNPYKAYLAYDVAQIEALQGQCSLATREGDYSSCVMAGALGALTFTFNSEQRLSVVCYWQVPTATISDFIEWYGMNSSRANDGDGYGYAYTFETPRLHITAYTDLDGASAPVTYSIFSILDSGTPVDINTFPVCR